MSTQAAFVRASKLRVTARDSLKLMKLLKHRHSDSYIFGKMVGLLAKHVLRDVTKTSHCAEQVTGTDLPTAEQARGGPTC